MNLLSKEEKQAACLLALRNNNLSEEQILSVKEGYCGSLTTDGKYALCFICLSKIEYNYVKEEFPYQFIIHIREHLKDLKVFI